MALAVCNGIQISYDDTDPNTTKTPVIFLHGHGLNRSMWDHQKQALRGSVRVVAVDLRGHGRSEKPKTGYSRGEEVKDLEGLLGVLRARRIHLVGLSRGAGLALAFAAAHPERTASVVAIGAGTDHARLMPEFADQRLQTMATLRAEGLRAAKEYWMSLPIFAPLRANPEALAKVEQMMLTYTGAHWLDPDPPKDSSLLELAPRITARTLIMVGEQDLPGFRASADEIAAKIPGAEKVVVPGAGHLTNLEAPEVITQALVGFLGRG
ncbi:MAG: alpha/beta fold hydrolase [Nitrospinota bacterium]